MLDFLPLIIDLVVAGVSTSLTPSEKEEEEIRLMFIRLKQASYESFQAGLKGNDRFDYIWSRMNLSTPKIVEHLNDRERFYKYSEDEIAYYKSNPLPVVKNLNTTRAKSPYEYR